MNITYKRTKTKGNFFWARLLSTFAVVLRAQPLKRYMKTKMKFIPNTFNYGLIVFQCDWLRSVPQMAPVGPRRNFSESCIYIDSPQTSYLNICFAVSNQILLNHFFNKKIIF